MRALFVASLICFLAMACKKDSDPAPGNPNNPNNPNNGGDSTDTTDPNELEAASLDSFLQSNSFHLSRYYADTAFDYIETDSVEKSETDFWPYVSAWLKDDVYTFGTDGNVTINQNEARLPADSSATLTRPYAVTADDDGVKFTFLTNDYMGLDYRLVSKTDTSLTVSAMWNGHVVKSDYVVVE
jgi:hypothetical protein